MTDFGRALYEREVKRRLLELREDLIRHDENAAALTLMVDCVPFFLADDPEIADVRDRTVRQSGHVRDPEQYRAYYEQNQNERPFEEQYGLSVEEAHRLPRVAFLRGALAAMRAGLDRQEAELERIAGPIRVLDLAGNDGFMAASLASLPFPVICDLVDLHPGNCDLARERAKTYDTIGEVHCAAVEDYADEAWGAGGPTALTEYDAVVAFELIEHVADPTVLLRVMCDRLDGGFLFVSTPLGAVEGGNLPGWDADEPKGHVRVFTEASFRALLERVGEVVQLMTGPDRVMVAQVKPR